MKVVAVITDSAQVLKILRHLIKTGKPPPVRIPTPPIPHRVPSHRLV